MDAPKRGKEISHECPNSELRELGGIVERGWINGALCLASRPFLLFHVVNPDRGARHPCHYIDTGEDTLFREQHIHLASR